MRPTGTSATVAWRGAPTRQQRGESKLCSGIHSACHPSHRLIEALMFPDPQDEPSIALERLGVANVPLTIALKFRRPVLRVRAGLAPMLWTGVPEATVDKDSDLPFCEDDVGPHFDTADVDPEVAAKAHPACV